MKSCYWCKRELEIFDRVRRDEICPFCKNDLHSCINCKFYNEGKHNKCSEPNSEWVGDKEKRNYCEYFIFRDSLKVEQNKDEIRTKAEPLFKSNKKN